MSTAIGELVGHEHHLVADELHGATAVGRHDIEGGVLERVDQVAQPFDGHALAELGEAAQVGEAHGFLDRVVVGLEPAAERRHQVPPPHVHQRVLEEPSTVLVERPRRSADRPLPALETGICAGERAGELLDDLELRFGDARERRAEEPGQPEDRVVVDETGTRQRGEALHDLDVDAR